MSSEDFLRKNKDLLAKAFDICSSEPPANDIPQLRQKVSAAVVLLPAIGKIRDGAEQHYRKVKQEVAERCPSELKSDARKNWIDGEASDASYQRDRCETMYEGLVLYISACKALMMNRNIEMSNLEFEN